MYNPFLKRALDIIISLCAIAVLFVPMAVIVILIKLSSPGPAIFRQSRLGKDKKPFYILKLRTMRKDAPADIPTDELVDSERWITPIGRFLRRTSLDEVPQLINVLIGQMSLVGPRPTVEAQTEIVILRERYGVYALRPGLTGWAQIHGRDSIPDTEKARLDSEYKERLTGGFFRGAFIDLCCIAGTFGAVIRGEGKKAPSEDITEDIT